METHIPLSNQDILIILILMIICLMMVGFFSSSEAALLSVKPLYIRNLARKGDKKAQAIERLRKRYDRLFGTILATENLFIILATSLGTVLAIAILGNGGVLFATIIMTILVVVLCEITPKTLGASFPEPFALAVSRILEIIVFILSPIVALLSAPVNILMKILGLKLKKGFSYSHEEILTALHESEKEGTIASDEREFIESVFDFGKTLAREVMVPRVEMLCLPENADAGDMKKAIEKTGHSRFPVYKDDLDNILGTVSVKDMFLAIENNPDIKVKELIGPCHFVPGTKRITTLLSEMRKMRLSMAIILDEYGGTAGLVTIETLLEEIVGDIDDEYDILTSGWNPQNDGSVIVDAHFPLDEIAERLKIPEPDCQYNTIGGYLISQIGRIPDQGESVMLGKYNIKAETMERYKLKKVRITRTIQEEEE